jgi:hypothetical protein
MSHRCFQELAAMLANSPLFQRWREGKSDAFDQPRTPLPLLVLCCLRYIGRGTFDHLSYNRGISDEIIRVFFTNLLSLVALFDTRGLLLLQNLPMKLPFTK